MVWMFFALIFLFGFLAGATFFGVYLWYAVRIDGKLPPFLQQLGCQLAPQIKNNEG